jgi:hypothetical protein
MKLEDRVTILKEYQVYCYRVCLSLLHEQRRAEAAACTALLNIAQISEFFTADPVKKRAKVRQAAIHAANEIAMEKSSTA